MKNILFFICNSIYHIGDQPWVKPLKYPFSANRIFLGKVQDDIFIWLLFLIFGLEKKQHFKQSVNILNDFRFFEIFPDLILANIYEIHLAI